MPLSRRAAHVLAQFFHRAEDGVHALQRRFASGVEADAVGLAVEQRRAQFGLELFQRRAHRRLRNVKPFRRPRQRAGFGDHLEGFQRVYIHARASFQHKRLFMLHKKRVVYKAPKMRYPLGEGKPFPTIIA